MAKMKCRTCGGTYDTDQARGTKYFHACPPIDIVTVDRAGEIKTMPLDDMLPGDILLTATTEPRPDARDENVVVTDYTKEGSAVTAVKREGRGTTPIAEPTKR